MKNKLLEQMFDFEVFPNWWCCVVGKYPQDDDCPESIKDDFLVVTSDMPNARDVLLDCMCNRDYVNMGYNIKYYDNIILNGVACGFTPRQLKILNDIIIDPERQYDSVEHIRIAPFARKKYNNFIYQDMMDDNTGSLKEKEACMQLDIRETTVPFDKEDLTDEDKDAIIFYCKHDVWSSMMFYKVILKPFIASKLAVGRVFNIPMDVCYKSTNAKLSAIALGAKKKSFPDAHREDIVIPAELKQYISYSLPASVINRLCTSPEKFEVVLFENDVSYSNGGIHSVPCRPAEIKVKSKFPAWFLHVKEGNGWSLINVDAGSFYPNMMVAWKGLSRAIPEPEKFASLIKTRLDLKSVIGPFEDKYGTHPELAPREEYECYVNAKEASQAYKLILNTTFGASGNKYLDLYDPYMTTYTCRLGQLLLTALANNLYTQIGKDNIKIIQTNTDGVLIYLRDEYKDLMYQIGAEWERICHIPLEFENEHQIWQRDVNNYVMGKANGRVKTKGGFFVTDMQQPGYNRVRPLDAYVCREAMIEYIAHDKDIVEHIYGESDISKFAVTCHKGSFSGILREFNDGREDEILHKVNRVYASLNTSLGMIYKTKRVKGVPKKYKAPGCPPHCELINDALINYDINKLRNDIDYMWYINETVDMLNAPWYEIADGKMQRYDIGLPVD
ncbi:MAG: hypothetical protein IKW20_08310 [Bacteroidales bacterium]|nr:hypothetical protein [Bacteroidales bacterium]